MLAYLKEHLSPRTFKGLKLGVGVALGAGAGFAYYSLVGCSTGGCPITSDPMISSIWGGLMGASIAAG